VNKATRYKEMYETEWAIWRIQERKLEGRKERHWSKSEGNTKDKAGQV
jgi:hypothetical protein